MLRVLLISFMIFFSLIPSSTAQQPMLPMECRSTTEMVQQLKNLDQKLLFFASTNRGIITLYQSLVKKDWFIILVPTGHPDLSCIIGDGFESNTIMPIDNSGRQV